MSDLDPQDVYDDVDVNDGAEPLDAGTTHDVDTEPLS